MNTKDETTQRNQGLSGESTLAIISVALSAFWIAFAYYHGSNTDAEGNRILLLHPLVPIALIALLIRIYRWVGIKFVVHLEIIMIGLWLFIRMLGVFMPFILGFGFAYLFRFLWRALPFKKYYQRAIATVLIVIICSSALIFTGIGVGNQLNQMTKGLQKYFNESLLPLVVGEEFVDLVYDEISGEQILYLATDHGIYLYYYNKVKDKKTGSVTSELKRKGITNGEIVGRDISAISVNEDYIYAGTESGVYRCSKNIVQVVTEENGDTKIILSNDHEWSKIDTNIFDTRPIQAINTPSWNSDLIYVGTNKGLYFSEDSGDEWEHDKSAPFHSQLIIHITSIEKFAVKREDIPKSIPRKNTPIYVASIGNTTTPPPKQNIDINTDDSEDASETQNTNSNKPVPPGNNTTVHKRSNPANEWVIITPESEDVQTINVLAAIENDNRNEELFAGTVNGLYIMYRTHKWEPHPYSNRLPQSVTILTASPTGVYAGDDAVIHYFANEADSWINFTVKRNGILAYRDSEIVSQFQEYLTEKIPGWTASGGAFVRWLSGLAGSIAFQFGGFLATLSLAFIVFVYASQGFDRYTRGFINLVPEKHRETAMAYLREIDRNMHQFLKGQFIVIVIITIVSCIIYHIIGVPFALLVGILAGLCNAIPTFGPFIGGGFAYIAMLMGLAAGEFTGTFDFPLRCIFVLGAILGIQAIDNSLISPKVMSNAVDVDPLLIMFAVIVGASILGFWGVLLAIPIIVVIKSIITVSQSASENADPTPVQEQP